MKYEKSQCGPSCSWCLTNGLQCFEKHLDKLEVEMRLEVLQKSALLGTACIPGKVLSLQDTKENFKADSSSVVFVSLAGESARHVYILFEICPISSL